MEIRLEFIMMEEGIVMEVLLGGDSNVDILWWLNVNLFCLLGYFFFELLKIVVVDCIKKFGMLIFFGMIFVFVGGF